jgi:hypothetical protein
MVIVMRVLGTEITGGSMQQGSRADDDRRHSRTQ